MEEPPVTCDNVGEPPDYVDIEDSPSLELHAEIQSHVEAIERRDADHFSGRVGQTHRTRTARAAAMGNSHAAPKRANPAATTSRTNSPRPLRLLRIGLALTIVSVNFCLVLFISNSGVPTTQPDIEITSHQLTADSYLTIRP
jgi:hypothetical protein